MRVDREKCSGCLECVDYCPVGAIREIPVEGVIFIDEDECVECGCCLRADVCPCDALWQQELVWPRILRAQFSNPRVTHTAGSGGAGRGTEEIKTNDVTGRYLRGSVVIAAELGRPGTGSRMEDVEKVAQAILPLGAELEKGNSSYQLFEDPAKGKLHDDIRKEKVLSAILEFKTTVASAPQVLQALARVANELDTVFSVDIGSMLEPDGSLPAERIAREAGFEPRPNGKNNLGLGRPRAENSSGGKL